MRQQHVGVLRLRAGRARRHHAYVEHRSQRQLGGRCQLERRRRAQNGDAVVINRPGATPVVTVQSAVVSLASLASAEPVVVNGGDADFNGDANSTTA